MKYGNLVVIGTSHIAKQSIEEVKDFIEKEKPDIIALELDRKRFYLLTKNVKRRVSFRDIFRVGVKGFLFALIGAYVQKKLGKLVGIAPGAEMKAAIRLAKKNKLKIALIDQDIEITLRKFSKNLSWREKWNFLVDLFKAFVLREKEVNFDLSKVPSEKLIVKLIKKVRKRYPNLYRVLIEERNIIMAHNLFHLMKHNEDKRILAVLGAGHKQDVLRLIKKLEKQNA